jgi:hypothetical protein
MFGAGTRAGQKHGRLPSICCLTSVQIPVEVPKSFNLDILKTISRDENSLRPVCEQTTFLLPARQVYPASNVAFCPRLLHKSAMGISQLFLGFLQPVALGSAAVFVVLGVIGLRTPRRSSLLVSRRTLR